VVSPFEMKARLEAEIIVMRHQLTDHPTAEWIAWQIAEAFPWDEALTDLIRDRDARYGHAVRRRLAASAPSFRERPVISFRSATLGAPNDSCDSTSPPPAFHERK
jgi:hypothetical protein